MSTTAIRFLVVRGRPLVLIDIQPATAAAAHAPRGMDHSTPTAPRPRLYRTLVDAGLSVIDSRPGASLATDVDMRWVLDGVQLQLETVHGRRVLRIGTTRIDHDWLEATRHHHDATLLAGTQLGLDRDDSTRQVFNLIDQATRRGRLVGARVPIEHQRLATIPPQVHDRSRRTRSQPRVARDARAATRAARAHGNGADDGRWWQLSPAATFGLGGVAALLVVALVGQSTAGEVIGSSLDPTRPVGFTATNAPPTSEPNPGSRAVPEAPATWVVAGPEGTPLHASPSDTPTAVAAPGLTWPILAQEGDGYRVATHCNSQTWVSAKDVVRPNLARGDGMAGAVIVLDAGHGGVDGGTAGSDGLRESDLNLEVAERLQTMLSHSNDIDPDTGAVTRGDQAPPAAAVLMTRDRESGKGGDQRASLSFRGQLASVAQADAFLSIHHNAGDEKTFDEPASEVYYSVADVASERLAGLVIEELRRSLAPLATEWRGTTIAGALGRQDPDGTDFYTVLEQATVPAVITEALYISDPDAELLATTTEFQNAQAEALYRALVRFLDTNETGAAGVNPASDYPSGEPNPYDYSKCSMAVDAA